MKRVVEENCTIHLHKLACAIATLDYTRIKDLTQDALDAGISPSTVVLKGLSEGMVTVGEKFERKEFFLAQLIMAADIMMEALQVIEPHLDLRKVSEAGVVIIGTVRGDLHDIGKNLAKAMLRSAGFVVHDLGVDVDKEAFVKSTAEHQPDIVAMSSLLLSTRSEMKEVIDELKKKKLRDSVKILIGGRPVTPEFAEEIGADAYAKNCVEGVEVAKRLMKAQSKEPSQDWNDPSA